LVDDILYIGVLLSSIAAGSLVRQIPLKSSNGVELRKIASTLIGIGFAYLVSGAHILHLFIEILINAVIINLTSKRICHLVSLTASFLYLFIFRFSSQLGLPVPPAHTNAIIMILTLKLVGLAFEIHDAGEAENVTGSKASSQVNPGFLDIFHYGLCHAGLITGPYYKFKVWSGMYSDSWNPAVSGEEVQQIYSALYNRAKNVPFYVTAFLISGYLFPLSIVSEDGWQESSSFIWKVFYMMPVFFNFRMRIYAGFCLSECACISAGLGAYPTKSKPRPGQGPSDMEALEKLDSAEAKKIDFETVHNIDEWGADFTPTMRGALKCWNMTVQHWLVMVVYKRFPVKSLRTTAVMLMSSVWHGVYSGYYLSLGSVPLCLVVEDLWVRQIRSRLSPVWQARFDWYSWWMRMRWFDYLGMGFLLLRVDTTMKYWSGVWFIGHLSLPVLYLLGLLISHLLPRPRESSETELKPSNHKKKE